MRILPPVFLPRIGHREGPKCDLPQKEVERLRDQLIRAAAHLPQANMNLYGENCRLRRVVSTLVHVAEGGRPVPLSTLEWAMNELACGDNRPRTVQAP